ncbi:MAG: Clp1/GlmU family protein [Candidatus Rokuibacteriota bacterium]
MTAWAPARHAAARARVTVVVGESEAGKTSLTTWLAGALAAGGDRVAVVDADLGQSEIGPPTTVGLGIVRRPLDRLAEAECLALEFVGATSAARCLRETARATARLVDRARALGFDRILVDTSGLVAGEVGRALKRLKIDAVRPDVLVLVQRAGECEQIARAYDGAGTPVVVRVAALASPVRRTPTVRRLHRERALAAALAGAADVDVAGERLIMPSGEIVRATPGLVGTLVALLGEDGEVRGLGWLKRVDDQGAVTIATAVPAAEAARVVVGRDRYRP